MIVQVLGTANYCTSHHKVIMRGGEDEGCATHRQVQAAAPLACAAAGSCSPFVTIEEEEEEEEGGAGCSAS